MAVIGGDINGGLGVCLPCYGRVYYLFYALDVYPFGIKFWSWGQIPTGKSLLFIYFGEVSELLLDAPMVSV